MQPALRTEGTLGQHGQLAHRGVRRPGDVVRRSVRILMVPLAVLLLSAPLAAALTIALFPVWSRLEARFGVESVGHSGPADWCYGVVYAGCVIVIASGVLWSKRRV
jgi:hypothetical protein